MLVLFVANGVSRSKNSVNILLNACNESEMECENVHWWPISIFKVIFQPVMVILPVVTTTNSFWTSFHSVLLTIKTN